MDMIRNIKWLTNVILSRFNLRIVSLAIPRRTIKVDYKYFPKPRSWAETGGIQYINKLMILEESAFANTLLSFTRFVDKFEAIPLRNNGDENDPYWLNGFLTGLDAVTIYGLLATRNPSVYVEIGSGNSTKFARRAIEDNGLATKIISVDPEPRAEIDSICDEIIRSPCEEVPISFFENLPSDMVLFLDGSHRSFQNSDVSVFFAEILPSLPMDCIWGIHDIFLPYDYSVNLGSSYYNEQYLLLAYLLGGGGNDTILLPNAFILSRPSLSQIVTEKIFASSYFNDVGKRDHHHWMVSSCFWMQRGKKT